MLQVNHVPFAFSKILDKGANHPVVARLQIQVGELLKTTSLSEPDRQTIFQACFDASLRLICCGDIAEKLSAERRKCVEEHQPLSGPQVATVPHIIGLQHEAETFLYEAKNFLRDVTRVLNAAFGTNFGEASQFCDVRASGDGEITLWAAKKFGPNDALTKFFKHHQSWIVELIRMRNAVEHPHGYSGVLHIRNFELMTDGLIRPPVWYRNSDEPAQLIEGMAGLCEQMLVFAEELVALIVDRNLAARVFQIYEISKDQRNPTCPRRFVVSVTPEFQQKFAEFQKESGDKS